MKFTVYCTFEKTSLSIMIFFLMSWMNDAFCAFIYESSTNIRDFSSCIFYSKLQRIQKRSRNKIWKVAVRILITGNYGVSFHNGAHRWDLKFFEWKKKEMRGCGIEKKFFFQDLPLNWMSSWIVNRIQWSLFNYAILSSDKIVKKSYHLVAS